jgi:hypothetical protein
MNSPTKVLGPLFRLFAAGLLFHTVFLPASLWSADKPSNLIKCPDCGKDVSRRAVHCPACGCPGEAIAAEANRIEDARVLKPVVAITASNGGGVGVAVDAGGKHVIAFLDSVGTGELLSLKSLADQEVPYSAIEVAENLPLVRLAVQGDAISYLPLSPTGERTGFLDATGHRTAGVSSASATLDASSFVSALVEQKTGVVVPVGPTIRWISMRPADFREQASLIARAKQEVNAGGLKPETRDRLAKTSWYSQYFKNQSEQLLTTAKEKQP